jgi:hypothetical protein
MFTTDGPGSVVATFSAPSLCATPSMVPAPGLLPDLVPGPLHIYAYALHGELHHAWRRFEVRDVGNWFDPIRIATGECEGAIAAG